MKRFMAPSSAKFASLFFAGATAFVASTAAHAIELSDSLKLDVTLTAVSDYRDTGVSQTKGDPAIQGEAILEHESGAYVGVFSSNVDFGSKARREDMYYVGVTIPFSEDVYLDTYVGRFEYPKSAYDDLNEFGAELGAYGFLINYTYDFDFRGHIPNQSNISLGYNFSLPYDTNLLVRYAYSDIRIDAFYSNSGDTRSQYTDWEARISKEVLGVNLFASYIDTDLSKSECNSATGYKDSCSATVVFGVSKTF
ncbi:TorF family putative porin [Pseudomonas sp. BGr12]|uniref:TorF family putative porin n=1 Tax=Pseudomonas sp. BGr12 TaxID=2936269 RepID=UPI0025598D78|nr:TorF family putative porin [Pseudomonas sp. BJa5]MDL2426322.1 TorF family putative porin [Pseudomonas sp. BJa5]